MAEWRGFWALPVAAPLGYSTAVLHAYSLGPFIEPLQHDFGWSRAQISIGITIAGVVGALFSVPIGLLVDRLRATMGASLRRHLRRASRQRTQQTYRTRRAWPQG